MGLTSSRANKNDCQPDSPRTLESDLEHADKLAQEVMSAWATHINAGNTALLAREFMLLFHKMLVYKHARERAESRRKSNVLRESDVVNERVTCEEFCKAYKDFREKKAS